MKKYSEAEMEVVSVVAEDIIQTSTPGPGPGPTPGKDLASADIMGQIVDYVNAGWDG